MVTRLITFGVSNTAANANSFLPTDHNLTTLPIGGTVFDSSGNLIVFATNASNLIGNDTNGQRDVYLYNNGTLKNLTLQKFNGTLTTQPSRNPSINSSGTRVVFESDEDNLSNQPSLVGSDIYLAENLNNSPPTFTLLTTNYNSFSYNPSISADGNWVVFETPSTTRGGNPLTGPGDNIDRDIILLNLVNNNTTWVSQKSGVGGNPATAGNSTNAAVSGDGRYVVFQSEVPENELISSVTGNNGQPDIFLFDRNDNSLTLVSRQPQVNPLNAGNGASTNPAINANGQFVVYQSAANNLLPPGQDSNGFTDIFLYEIATGQNTRISLRPGNLQTNANSFLPSIDSSGNFVAFASDDALLVQPDNNTATDIFVWKKGATTPISMVSINSNGNQADQPSTNPAISPDGKKVAFQSTATTLGQPVQNGITNIFVNEEDVATTLSINDVALNEGNSGTTAFNFTVTLSTASTQTVTVAYATADQTATVADSDYTAANGTLTFAPGEMSKTISVAVIGDTKVEPNETFLVNLTNPTGNATLGDAQGVGTINNDDGGGGGGVLTDPIYRFYNTVNGGHFFTADPAERDNVLGHPEWGYNFENVGFRASDTPGPNLMPVYRFYSEQTRGHFFTTDATERATFQADPKWRDENIGFYAYGANASLGVDVSRFFNSGKLGYAYTLFPDEKNLLINVHPEWGYVDQGIAFEAANPS